jgi:prevent-host-death family protein
MTSRDYLEVMKSVDIAELKSRLSEYLREVKRGHSFTVMDRSTPVATVVPYEAGAVPLRVREPLGRFPSPQDVPLPPPLKTTTDVVDLLLEERGER